MKKILLMTMGTALLGTGAIAQGVSISGSGGMGFRHEAKEIIWISDFDVGFSASGTTDGGLTFGGAVKVKGGGNVASDVGKSNVYVSGEAWKVSIGDLDPATHMARPLGDVGYDGDLGVDNVAEDAVGSTTAGAKAEFTLGNATLGITTGVKEKKNEWAVGLNVDAGGMSFGAGTDSQKLVAVSAKASMGGISAVLYYAKDQVEVPKIKNSSGTILPNTRGILEQSGLGASASFDASDNTTVSIVWAKGKGTYKCTVSTADDGCAGPGYNDAVAKLNKSKDNDGIGIGISTDLGGGATLKAGIAKVKGASKVGAGISMSF